MKTVYTKEQIFLFGFSCENRFSKLYRFLEIALHVENLMFEKKKKKSIPICKEPNPKSQRSIGQQLKNNYLFLGCVVKKEKLPSLNHSSPLPSISAFSQLQLQGSRHTQKPNWKSGFHLAPCVNATLNAHNPFAGLKLQSIR